MQFPWHVLFFATKVHIMLAVVSVRLNGTSVDYSQVKKKLEQMHDPDKTLKNQGNLE